jgi:Tfp pilus assembly protein PilF
MYISSKHQLARRGAIKLNRSSLLLNRVPEESIPPTSVRPSGYLGSVDKAIWVTIVLSVLLAYIQTARFDFVNYDDGFYVYRNADVRAGLSLDSIRGAFTSVIVGHWVPITMLSHMAVSQLFHLDGGMHHLANVFFHLLSSLLLFQVLKRSTGARWPSAFVALIFALHPVHVESVAWVSERKDVLSTFFWFAALYGYVHYTEAPSRKRYLLVVFPFCLGLMSKAMLVTFPFTLLLFDIWPLRRAKWPQSLLEKLPLITLSLGFCLVTYLTQESIGAVEAIPFGLRIENSLVNYIVYLGQTIWPVHLAVFYPYPPAIPTWKPVIALVAILCVSGAAIVTWRSRPYIATGWFWYLGTLVPVIGVLAVGDQSRADHFMYVPMVGLLMVVAWGAADVIDEHPGLRTAVVAGGAAGCVACLGLTFKQTSYWRNSETLYQHAIEVTGDNWLAEGNLGNYLMNYPDRREEAVQHLENALRIRPTYADAHNNLGLSLSRIDLCGVAIPHFETALQLRPEMVQARNNLASCLTRTGNYGAAIGQLEIAIQMNPRYAAAHFNLADTYSKLPGREKDAIAEYEAGLRVSPNAATADNAVAHRSVGKLLMGLGRTEEAAAHFAAAQKIQADAETADTLMRLRP